MKPATLLALPALALAAATPAKVEERQLPGVPVDPTCILRITGITGCVPSLGGLDPTNPPTTLLLSQLVGLATCPIGIILDVVDCIL
ncbi:hypothetical protein MRS44_015451 [Fusarium solani]|uniref:Hydrophobin n=1 Tax=Fusarium solani TaxID=169388 RepID=A0A9P9H9I1_FUSSL|nr:uncharacterized protein B0J15DRAFT_550116 [Fusarium solani]KAH7253398.1 hypothetical protein B0J15DRAFT_550116 [Fusarium solani]KAJ3459378.1 hypothetical protein MRS44_015451 [Fusarium solani]KAJ4221100.1 hypothetical protein NW759_007168 [Fusarium solani]